jgi:hypothetical protein
MIASLRFDPTDSFRFSTIPTQSVPVDASILVGEAIQGLRRSLDYLVYEVAFLDSGVEQDHTQFPIDRSDKTFWSRLQRNSSSDNRCYLVGVSKEHALAIERYQPYKGTAWTKTLNSISNQDKHRHLTIARREVQTSAPLWSLADSYAGHEATRTEDGFSFFLRVNDPPPTRVQMKVAVSVFIAFDYGTRVVETIEYLKSEVANVLADFRPCFEGNCHH